LASSTRTTALLRNTNNASYNWKWQLSKDNQEQHLHKVNSNQVAKRMFFIKAFEIVHIWEQIQFEDVFSSKV